MPALTRPVRKEYQYTHEYLKELTDYESEIRRRRFWAVMGMMLMVPYYFVALLLAAAAIATFGNFAICSDEERMRDFMYSLWHSRVKKIAIWGGLTKD